MNVLIVNPSFEVFGGAERLIVTLANAMSQRGIRNTIATTVMRPDIRICLRDTRTVETGDRIDMNRMSAVVKAMCDDFDVLSVHNAPAHLLHVPRRPRVVWMCNEPPISYLKDGVVPPDQVELTRAYITSAVVADEYNRDRFRDIYDMDAEVIHYGIDHEFFSHGDAQAAVDRYNLSGRRIVLHVGYLTFTKRQVRTVGIFSEVKKQDDSAILVLAGPETSYKFDVLKEMRKLGVDTKDVVFTGEVQQGVVRDLYHAAARNGAVISPIGPQGGWLSVFEAVSAGAPVMVSTEMTAASLVESSGVGVVGDGDQDFVNFVLNSQSPESRARAAEKSAWVRDNLTWDKFCNRMIGALMHACGTGVSA